MSTSPIILQNHPVSFSPHPFLRALLTLPTAPYHEHHVFRWISEQITSWPNTRLTLDPYGNILLQTAPDRRRPLSLLFVAHLDHPGFVVDSFGGVTFLGHVDHSYLIGASVRFYRLDSMDPLGTSRILRANKIEDRVQLKLETVPEESQFGVWDLPEPVITSERIEATAIDDLAGVAALLAALESCAREGLAAAALFTRAEEVGFQGTRAWIKSAPISVRPVVISVEMSNHRGWAEPGAGPVLRVGDRASVFSPEVLHPMQEVLSELVADRDFVFQRKLMGGGTCEVTPFARAGFPVGGLCLPLLNYHNQGPEGRIAPEAVVTSDWNHLVQALVHLMQKPLMRKRPRTNPYPLSPDAKEALRKRPLS